MQVTKQIRLEMGRRQVPPVVWAKQNDRDSRLVMAALYDRGSPFQLPEAVTVVFRAKKPDGTAVLYDTGEEGSLAVSVQGNVVKVVLAEQVLTSPGDVHAEISLYTGEGEKLTSFPFVIRVEKSVLTDEEVLSGDYYNILTAKIAEGQGMVAETQEAAKAAEASAQKAEGAAREAEEAVERAETVLSGAVQSVNGVLPDEDGDVQIEVGAVQSVNGVLPDENGDVQIEAGGVQSVNGVLPDESGDVQIESGGVKSVNGVLPDAAGDVPVNLFASNLLHNWFFPNPVDQRGGYVAPPNTPIFTNPELTQTGSATASTIYNPVTQVNGVGYISTGYYFDWAYAQRGYRPATSKTYTVDRWYGTSSSSLNAVLVEDDGIRLHKGSPSHYINLRQPIENPERLAGQTVTFSALAKGDTRFYVTIDGVTHEYYDLTDDWTLCTITMALGDSLTSLTPYFGIATNDPAGDVTIKAAKLELGSVQTLAHQDENGDWVLNQIPDYGEELAKCQRYFYKLQAGTALSAIRLDRTAAGNTTQLSAKVQLPMPMRANPALSYSALSDFVVSELTAAAGAAPTKMTRYQFDTGNLIETIVCNGSYTVGTHYSFILNKGGWLTFSADL